MRSRGDHLPIDRVGDGDGAVPCNQAQVAHVLQVVGGNRVGGLGTTQQGLHDPAYAFLLELVGELIQVRLPAKDQLLPGILNRVAGDRPASVPHRLVLEAGFVGEGIHQPRLAPGQLPDCGARLAHKRLAGLLGVLGQQRLGLRAREVSEPQRLGADVEGAPASDDRILGGRPDAVVAHVAHPAQDDGLRKPGRAFRVTRPKLAQHGEQGVADQRVDLVDHEHERLCVRAGHCASVSPRASWGPAASRMPGQTSATNRSSSV